MLDSLIRLIPRPVAQQLCWFNAEDKLKISSLRFLISGSFFPERTTF